MTPLATGTEDIPPTSLTRGARRPMEEIVSVETLKVALEAVQMVYKHNVVWLQTQGREQEFVLAMDELAPNYPQSEIGGRKSEWS